MMTPDFPAFKKLASKGNLIAVMKSVPADLETPVSTFLKLAKNLKHTFLLESAEQAERVGRYSIIGLEPSGIVTGSHSDATLVQSNGRASKKIQAPVLSVLESLFKEQKLANPEQVPGFTGGWVGFLSYECVEEFETIRLSEKKNTVIPQSIFFLTRDYVVFDHFRKTLSVVSIAKIEKRNKAAAAYTQAARKIENVLSRLRRPLKHAYSKNKNRSAFKLIPNMSPAEFKKKVARIKEYIRAGDCIQVVLSQKFSTVLVKDDFKIYRALRSLNPSPYMFYFRSGKYRLIGSSPELLVKNSGKKCEVRPIAGTRPRGRDEGQDASFEDSLKRSVKEMAEHLMLVDLGRNDLGRVCRFSSIRVENFARVERYSHVMHLVSDVKGDLLPGKTSFDLLRAAFPAGTVSGAPKIRAMQIIDELEEDQRGPYAGSLGFIGFNRDMEMCITIRTLMIDGKKMILQAGAGIVKDSDPSREYQETVNKAKAMVQALLNQENF